MAEKEADTDKQQQQEQHKQEAPQQEEQQEPTKQKIEEEDDDDEEDEDYNPDAAEASDSDDEPAPSADYAKIESSEGGLVKTRRQRLLEEQERKEKDYKLQESQSNVDINSIWQELNSTKKTDEKAVEKTVLDKGIEEEEKIKISRRYEYAGETIVEEKWVPASSAEAKAYLNSVKLAAEPKAAEVAPKPKPVRKRKKSSIVDSIIGSQKMAKLSTLEKSRLDWANYVDKNKLNDELKSHNMDGYLTKQDFLNRVESNIDRKLKEAK